MIGKYLATGDAYKSVLESVSLCGYKNPQMLDAEDLEKMTEEEFGETLERYSGIIIPGGFGHRGIEGMVRAIRYARENDKRLLGLCLGMQLMTIEYARNVAGLEGANSTEFDPDTPYPVIDLMEEQKRVMKLGGTMRLGAEEIKLSKWSKLHKIYSEDVVVERHRHRYEVNVGAFRGILRIEESDPKDRLNVSAMSEFVEAVELSQNRFHIGVQYHPEYVSKISKPHPLFVEFLKTCEES